MLYLTQSTVTTIKWKRQPCSWILFIKFNANYILIEIYLMTLDDPAHTNFMP